MPFLKRGLFAGRKGGGDYHTMWAAVEFTLAFIFVAGLAIFMIMTGKDTTFERNFQARDLALTIDALYMSPQDMTFVSYHDAAPYIYHFKAHRVSLSDQEGLRKNDFREYWFADEVMRRFDYVTEPIKGPTAVLFSLNPSTPPLVSADIPDYGIKSPPKKVS